jgi:nucleotide-binding universal stress UspA family protein
MNRQQGIIVVGVDGGPQGDDALRFAVEEAERTGDTVEVVTAFVLSTPPVTGYGLVSDLPTLEDMRREAQAGQDASVARVLKDARELEMAFRVERGGAGPVLVRAAERARLLVVGSRGHGPVRAVLLGSVSRYCAHHARCPVVIVPSGVPVPDEAELAIR